MTLATRLIWKTDGKLKNLKFYVVLESYTIIAIRGKIAFSGRGRKVDTITFILKSNNRNDSKFVIRLPDYILSAYIILGKTIKWIKSKDEN